MPRQNAVLARFNYGLVSPRALARTDLARVGFSAETMDNWVTRSFGNMMLRPGFAYLGATASNAAARYIPFIFSQSDTALLEFTDVLMRVWISDALMTRASVSTSITNGTFDTALTGWTDDDDAGGTSAWATGGYMSLIGDGTNYARRYQKITVASADRSTAHAVTVVVERGDVTLLIGSGIDTDNILSETELTKGTHSLSFTPDADFYITVKSRDKYEKLLDSIAVESSGTVTITSPFAAADLDNIRYRQSGDVIYLACDGYQSYKIERRTSTSWSIVRYYPEKGPFRSINITDTSITPSATSGNITLTASSGLFKPTHKESLWRLVSAGQTVSDTAITAENTFTSAIEVNGVGDTRIFQVTIVRSTGTTITLQRSFDSSTGPWTDVNTWTASVTSENYDDQLDNFQAWYRIGVKTGDYGSGTTEVTLDYSSGAVEGIVRITSNQYDWIINSAAVSGLGYGVGWSPALSIFLSCGGAAVGNDLQYSSDGKTWTGTASTSVGSTLWQGVAWSPTLALFVIVGEISATSASDIDSSPDGTTWTSRTPASGNGLNDVCWSPDLALFCAVGDNGTIHTSSNGTSWTKQTAAAADTLRGVCWSPELTLFVTVGLTGAVQTSPDGTTWTSRTAAESNSYASVCWSPELNLLVAVSYDGTNRVMTSPDGTTWTAHSASEALQWISVDWSPQLGIYVAVAYDATASSIMYSTDGTTWTSSRIPQAASWRSIVWAPEVSLFCATSSNNYAGITTSDGKSANAEVLVELGNTGATKNWYEGQWSDYRGWPTSVGLIEGRVAFAGRNKFNASVSDDYQNFDDTTIGDSGPLQRTIGGGPVDTINWILEIQRAILGGQAEEYICKSSTQDEILTPTTLTIRPTSTKGSHNVQGVKVDHTGVFAQKNGTRLIRIAIGQSGEYESVDISGITPETFAAGIKRIAVQYLPEERVINVMNDGTVVIGQHDPLENVFGFYTWSSTAASGLVEDVVILPGTDATDEDSVYFVIQRTVNSSTVRYLEKMALESECTGGTLNKQLDSFILYSGASTTTITGLSHLEGETVYVWGDGVYLGSYTVSGGQITGITTAVTNAVVGLTYTAQFKSTKLAFAAGLGTALTQLKKISHLSLIAKDLHPTGITYGPDFTVQKPLPGMEQGKAVDPDTIWSTYDNPAFEFDGQWNSDSRLCLQAQGPKPANILAAIISVEGHDKY